MAQVLSLGFTACQVVIQTLLDLREDTDHKLAHRLIDNLATDHYTAVSERILIRLVEFYPTQVTNEILEALVPPHIRHLNLSGCTNLSAAGLHNVYKKCYRLSAVVLNRCDQILRAPFFRMTGARAPALTGVTMEGCSSLTDHGVRTLLQCFPNLRHLVLRSSDNVTDEMFLLDERLQFSRENRSASSGLPPPAGYQCGLLSVDISQCSGLTSTAVRHLTTLCGPSLQAVNISWTEIDCTALWYLSGYSLSTAAQLAVEVDRLQSQDITSPTSSHHTLTSEENKMVSSETHKQSSASSTLIKDKTGDPDKSGELLSPLSLLSTLSPTNPNSQTGATDCAENVGLNVVNGLVDALKLHEYEDCNLTLEASSQIDACDCCDDKSDVSSFTEEPMVAWESPRDKAARLGRLQTGGDQQGKNTNTPGLHALESDIEGLVSTTISELKNHKGNQNLHSAKAFTNLSMDYSSDLLLDKTDQDVDEVVGEALCDDLKIDKNDLSRPPGAEISCPPHDIPSVTQQKRTENNGLVLNDGFENVETDSASAHSGKRCLMENEAAIPQLSLSNPTANVLLNPVNTAIPPLLNENMVVSECSDLGDQTNSLHKEMGGIGLGGVISELYALHCDSESCDIKGTSMDSNIKNDTEYSEINVCSLDGKVKEEVAEPSCSSIPQSDNHRKMDEKDDTLNLLDMDNVPKRDRESVEFADKSSQNYSMGESTNQRLLQVFKPNLRSLCINGINFHTRELGEACLKAFFITNYNMEHFEMNWNEINDEILTFIGEHGASLKNISLTECDAVISIGLRCLFSKCKMLEKVNLQGVCFIGDAAIIPLVANKQVKKLNLAECNITSQTLDLISRSLNVQLLELDLSWCEEVDIEGVESIAEQCTGLTALSLRQCPIRGQTLGVIADNLTSLTYLNVSGVDGLDDKTLVALAVRLRLLQKLDIGWNMDVTDVGMTAVMSHCVNLRELISAGIKQITSAPFTPIISDVSRWRKCQTLLRFKYHEHRMLEDIGEQHYSSDEEYEDVFLPHRSTSYSPNLRKLDVEYCDKIQDHLMEEIVAVCRGTLTIKDYYGSEVVPSYVACQKGKVFRAPCEQR